MSRFYILLGPPGAGKGTQAAIIAEKCGIPHISSGNIFRENLLNDTELGKQARFYMKKGELVPDGITIGMVEDRLSKPDCKEGALLDGYPRTPKQAQALNEFLKTNGNKINAVPFINVPSNELIERLSGRWTCKAESHVYHLKYKPPKQVNICDLDGSALYQREDDKRETVEQRIKVYLEQTAPLIAFYRKDSLLFEVDGSLPIEQVTDKLMHIVNC
ncbi:MAG: adenylate kinase [Anaerolineaceae bacterium]|nr:adenylate kinase [Anaerolineaceae bacterium]